MKFLAKVIDRKITPIQGKLLITLESSTTDGKGVVTTIKHLCSMNTEQIQMLNLIGGSVPTVGSTITVEPTVNLATGEVNQEWVTISI